LAGCLFLKKDPTGSLVIDPSDPSAEPTGMRTKTSHLYRRNDTPREGKAPKWESKAFPTIPPANEAPTVPDPSSDIVLLQPKRPFRRKAKGVGDGRPLLEKIEVPHRTVLAKGWEEWARRFDDEKPPLSEAYKEFRTWVGRMVDAVLNPKGDGK
jgi:hypothetical protein